MKFNADEIASVIQREIEHYESQIDVREVGTVLEVGDGMARVYGLFDAGCEGAFVGHGSDSGQRRDCAAAGKCRKITPFPHSDGRSLW